MPCLSFFADDWDVQFLVQQLNSDREVAFLVPDGPVTPNSASRRGFGAVVWVTGGSLHQGADDFTTNETLHRQRWKAVQTVQSLADGEHSLWHNPAGPLPLLTNSGRDRPIPDPWTGWIEEQPGADPTTPYFGPGHHAHIRLTLNTRHRPYSDEERKFLPVLNSFWTGSHDQIVVSDFQWIGSHYSPAPKQTSQWWNRLKRWFAGSAAKLVAHRLAFWAMPSAFARLRAGLPYYARGANLSESIQSAEFKLRNPAMRDVFPPSSVQIEPSWLTSNVVALAQAIYDENSHEQLPILADALEEAGCVNAEILKHCRGKGPHGRGCWVLTLLLGKEPGPQRILLS